MCVLILLQRRILGTDWDKGKVPISGMLVPLSLNEADPLKKLLIPNLEQEMYIRAETILTYQTAKMLSTALKRQLEENITGQKQDIWSSGEKRIAMGLNLLNILKFGVRN